MAYSDFAPPRRLRRRRNLVLLVLAIVIFVIYHLDLLCLINLFLRAFRI